MLKDAIETSSTPQRELTKSVITVSNFNAGFKKTPILSNINLSIPRNRVTCLVGPSGSGKSTLLRTLNRINDDTDGFIHTGSISWNGKDIFDSSIDVHQLRTKIGMVFQRPCVFPRSIFENVLFGLSFQKKLTTSEKKKVVEEKLKDVGLWDEVLNRLDTKANQLSIGQQQRLCIARTLAIEPEVILLDEPTSSLDPISSNAIENLILKLKDSLTIICVTHNLDQAKKVADKIVFMCNGEIVEAGTKDEMINNPQHFSTREYFKDYYCNC